MVASVVAEALKEAQRVVSAWYKKLPSSQQEQHSRHLKPIANDLAMQLLRRAMDALILNSKTASRPSSRRNPQQAAALGGRPHI